MYYNYITMIQLQSTWIILVGFLVSVLNTACNFSKNIVKLLSNRVNYENTCKNVSKWQTPKLMLVFNPDTKVIFLNLSSFIVSD